MDGLIQSVVLRTNVTIGSFQFRFLSETSPYTPSPSCVRIACSNARSGISFLIASICEQAGPMPRGSDGRLTTSESCEGERRIAGDCGSVEAFGIALRMPLLNAFAVSACRSQISTGACNGRSPTVVSRIIVDARDASQNALQACQETKTEFGNENSNSKAAIATASFC